MAVAVVLPNRFAARSSLESTYVRRRRLVGLVVAAIVLVLLLGAGRVVANRGGAPASASTVRSAAPQAAPAPPGAAQLANVYVVRPGDTLWSIGERFHGRTPLAEYVDLLVERNGGTHLDIAQPLALP
jgi:hypothetical protein